MPSNRAETPVAFIRAIVAGYHRYGMDPAAALANAGIAPALLDVPGGRVTARQMELMSEYAMRELDDEALGWFSRRLPWGSYGMLCRASITAPTLGVALKRWCRHHRLLVDDVDMRLTPRGDSSEVAIIETTDLGPLREFCLVTLLRYVLGFACWATDSRIPLTDAAFPFPRPPHDSVYAFIFTARVQFDAPAATLRFDARYLDLPLVRDEDALRAMLRRALPLTVLQYRRDRLLVDRARLALTAHPEECRDAERLAARLNVSTRTLYRRLHEAGTSLQQLKDEARSTRARELLRRTARPLAQVARAVGFDNEKSFARAFRRWTGVAPGAYRRGGG